MSYDYGSKKALIKLKFWEKIDLLITSAEFFLQLMKPISLKDIKIQIICLSPCIPCITENYYFWLTL